MDLDDAVRLPLQRSVSSRSHRSATARASNKSRKLISNPSSSASSIIAPSDKSLTSFPSFSPEPFVDEATRNDRRNGRGRRLLSPGGGGCSSEIAATRARRDTSGRRSTIVDSLTWRSSAREALFEDTPISHTVPGALHSSDDEHIERLVARHGAVALVRQIAGDLAQRDAQISALRRRADERERALRRILRDCGLSNLDLETRLRAVEAELRDHGTCYQENGGGGGGGGGGLSDLMSDAMQDVMAENVYGETSPADFRTIRANGLPNKNNNNNNNNHTNHNNNTESGGKGTISRGWKDYLWGGGTTRTAKRLNLVAGSGGADPSFIRSPTGAERPSILTEDVFHPLSRPPNRRNANDPSRSSTSLAAADASSSVRSSSRGSSVNSANRGESKGPTSLASLALRLVAGGAIANRDGESRGRAASSSFGRPESARTGSAASSHTTQSARAASAAAGPKALMAMRRPIQTTSAPASTKVAGSPPGQQFESRPEAYGPVEMDAILPPESQPPTLTQMYNNYPNCEYLTDRYGFIYDQRRKKRQREAAQMVQHMRKGSRTEFLAKIRTDVPPTNNNGEDLPSPKWSVSSDQGRPGSPSSTEERASEEGRAKRWQDYLRIATIPTELLSHTPGISALTIVEAGAGTADEGTQKQASSELMAARAPAITAPAISPPVITSPAIRPAVITPSAVPPLIITPAQPVVAPPASSATTAVVVDEVSKQPCERDSTGATGATGGGTLVKEDAEPVRLLLQQLSDMHESLQREKTVRWNDFLRKVRAERRREGEAAMAAAAAAAEARYQRPAVILPETRVIDGEMIGISNLGNKGKIGRAKWNEFKSLVLSGIPVAYRAKVWSECSGATTLRVPGYYEDLVSRTVEGDDPTVVTQIEMDIRRTLTDNIFFRNGPGVKKLNEVLLAYSRRNKDVGYCQGMNLIAANLLLITPTAEDAFWILASIIERILPHGYYDDSLISSRADQQVLRQYVGTVLPKLSAHLDSLSIELEALTFQWFLSVFTDCLCAEALFRVWDVVLCTNDGSTFLFQVALALLKLNESNLLRCDAPAAVYTYINHQMTEHAISIDGLIQASEGLRRVVKREDVEQRREQVMQAEKDLAAERRKTDSPPSNEAEANEGVEGHGVGSDT